MNIDDKLRFGIFKALTNDQINEINKNHFEVSFKAGETIFKQGNALTHIICISKGKAKVLLEDYHNQTTLLRILKQSNIIGGPGFATDYRHYFSVVAIEDTQTCFIDVKYFMNLVINNPDFAVDLIAYLNRGFINHYDQLKGISNKYMSGRMADTLL